MRFLSLFSGAGLLDLGLEWAGWACVWHVERDPFCRAVLAHHWPGVPLHDDIRSYSGLSLGGRVDAVVGGPPCQPASLAGKRRGAAGERWLGGGGLCVGG